LQDWRAAGGAAAAREVVRDYAAWVESSITAAMIVRASEIGEVWRISFRDAMIRSFGHIKNN